jgi:PAS domain S-box-containing protein
LFERATDGIFVADLDGRYTDVNEAGCRMLGCTRSDIVGKRIVDLIPPEDVERLARSKQDLLEGGLDRTEWLLRHKDGHYIPIEIGAKILPDGVWLALVRDITERKRVQQAAADAAAELERRIEERTSQLRGLSSELAAAEDRERREIARDLHDDLGQTLAAARIRLARLRESADDDVRRAAGEIDELIGSADRATRSLAAQLAPPVLYELGLVPALEWLSDELRETYGLEVELIDDGAPKPLVQAARAILYRAVRELLINVAKHAGVKAATVETLRRDDRLLVRVNDAGVGFDHEEMVRAPRRGLGLASVRERVSYIGGSVDVRSVPGDGTLVEMSVPLASDGRTTAEPQR